MLPASSRVASHLTLFRARGVGLVGGRGRFRGYQSGSAGVFGHHSKAVEELRTENEQKGTVCKKCSGSIVSDMTLTCQNRSKNHHH
jgi:hypothetical protein